MNLKEIKELIKIIDGSNLSEFHIEQDDIKLTIKKEIVVKQYTREERNDYLQRETMVNSIELPVAIEKTEESNLHIIKSPIVGIYYSSPSPELPTFVKTGDNVKVGQVLCIIEAMKLMNEITSDIDGEIIELLGMNQGPIEFGQPLFKIRKV